MTDNSHFLEIVASYMEAADHLGLGRDHVEVAVRHAARRGDMAGQCASCRFSRAAHNVLAIAQDEDRLAIYDRKCIFRHLAVNHCEHWKRLEVPGLRARCEFCGYPLSGEEPRCHCGGFASEEERQTFFRNSPKSRSANRPDGGHGHGYLRFRRAGSLY